MVDPRTALAAVLGIGLGLVLMAFPAAIIRVQTVGRLPDDRGGEYGESTPPPETLRRVVQAIGVALVLAGTYFAAVAIGTPSLF